MDLLERLPPSLQVDFLIGMLPQTAHKQLLQLEHIQEKLTFVTQFQISVQGQAKYPDIAVLLDGTVILLVEVKVNAAEQEHKFTADPKSELGNLPEGTTKDEIIFIQGQLKTYSDWMAKQSRGTWPGAVVFLTHNTPAPPAFGTTDLDQGAAINSIRTWGDVGDWLSLHVDLLNFSTAHTALAADYKDFLVENGFMAEYVTSKDLSATELFLPSYSALNHTFSSVARAVIAKYPTSKGGRLHVEFWAEGGVFWAWYYLNGNLNPAGTRYYFAFGICFPETGTFGGKDGEKTPRYEPFLFILFADDRKLKKASDIVVKIPDGWVQLSEEYEAVVAKPVSHLTANPDLRAKEMVDWAIVEIGRLVASISGFDAAPIEPTAPEEGA